MLRSPIPQVTFRRVTGITEAAGVISEYAPSSLGWVSLGGHGDGKALHWVPPGGSTPPGFWAELALGLGER